MFGIGLVFFAVGYIGLGLTTDTVTAWLLIGVYGLFTGCTDGVGKAWISSLVGSDLQGSAQGVFQGASGFAVLAAGLWAGFLWGADGRLPLLISGVVGAVFAVVLARDRAALPTRHDDLDVVEGVGRRPDTDDRVAALRCALGDPARRLIGHRSSTSPAADPWSARPGRCSKIVPCQWYRPSMRIEAARQPHPHRRSSSPMRIVAAPS